MEPSTAGKGRVNMLMARIRRFFAKAGTDNRSNNDEDGARRRSAPIATAAPAAAAKPSFTFDGLSCTSGKGAEFARGIALPEIVVVPNANAGRRTNPATRPSRVVFIGAKSCGKTSLCGALAGYPEAPFQFRNDVPETIGCDFMQAWFRDANDCNDVLYGQHLWDFAGNRRFRSVMNQMLRNVQVLVICCAGDNPLSVAEVEELHAVAKEQINSFEKTVTLLVVLKTDLPPAVSVADLRALCVRIDARLVFVSAKTGEGLDQLRRLLWFAARNYEADTVVAEQRNVICH